MKTTWYGVLLLAFIQSRLTLAEIIVDGSLGGTPQSLPGPNYAIEQSLGQSQGGNLFHSFSQFNINTGESANFQASSSINNIFARVTGGNASLIDGGITTNSTANLWMINPAGWVIGHNAAINLPGAFHLSTATSLDFKDGGQFLADPGSKSTLSMADPIDFQFQDAKQAAITIDQAKIVIKDGKYISLVGGDIRLKDAHISAPGGRILLGSNAGTEGKWQLDDQGLTQVSGRQGVITVQHGINQTTSAANPTLSINAPIIADTLNTGGGSGKIQLTANQITLENAYLSAIARNNVSHPGGTIELQGESIQLAHSSVSTSVFGDQAGGNINIVGKDLIMTGVTNKPNNGSILKSDTNFNSNGAGGSITINLSGELLLNAQSNIATRVQGTGTGGNITISSPQINLDQKSAVTVDTFGEGNSGTITLNSNNLTLKLNSFVQSSASLGSQGNAGNIVVNSPNITMDQSFMLSATANKAKGETGNIAINTQSDQKTDSGALVMRQSVIGTSNLGVQGNGGTISVDTGTLVMNGGYIQANTAALTGKGGTVTVNALRTLVSQEQLLVGGDRKNINQQPDLNVIQAANPNGENGQVNVSPVELNIAGQLAKVDASFANNRPIANDPCSVGRGGETSSLIQTGNGGLAPNAGDAVSLPLSRHSKARTSDQQADNADTPLLVALNSSNLACEKDKR